MPSITSSAVNAGDKSESARVPSNRNGRQEPRIVIEYSERMAEGGDDLTSIPPAIRSKHRRPANPRSCTDPSPAGLLQGWAKEKELQERPRSSSSNSNSNSNSSGRSNQHRNRSPYSRSHLRSRSSGTSALSAPLMTRAHSMPNPHMPRTFDTLATSPTSGSLSPTPLRSPARARSPFKTDEATHNPIPRSLSWLEMSSGGTLGMGIESIQEDSELDITPRALPQLSSSSSSASSSFTRSNPLRSTRGTTSPLHSLITTQSPPTSAPISGTEQSTQHHASSSGSNSPAINPQKYNEAYPASLSLHHYASNSSFSSFSMPSTPTSARSRSPSISSLETIEDAPEEEETKAEAEAEAIDRLKLATDSESDGEGEGPRRRSLDVPRAGVGRRAGLGSAAERKRWSVCGGERRADLDLETIWED